MAQLHKLELQTLIISSPQKFFDVYHTKTSLMPSISPDKLQSIEVLEGDGKSVGSVRLWTYVMGKIFKRSFFVVNYLAYVSESKKSS